jgi:hypothetical protein
VVDAGDSGLSRSRFRNGHPVSHVDDALNRPAWSGREVIILNRSAFPVAADQPRRGVPTTQYADPGGLGQSRDPCARALSTLCNVLVPHLRVCPPPRSHAEEAEDLTQGSRACSALPA